MAVDQLRVQQFLKHRRIRLLDRGHPLLFEREDFVGAEGGEEEE
jgi:hypothetical protein